MKKILFATTALVASASFAMADVDLSGNAEMGVFDNGDGQDLEFHTDIDVTFSLSGETDNGVTFGASIDLDESDDDGGEEGSGAFENDEAGGETIFVSGAFGTLTMGDTDGALDFALNEAIIGSAINDDHEHDGYSGNDELDNQLDSQVARYDYSFDAFSVAVSAELDDDGSDIAYGIGAKYEGEFAGASIGVGIAFQDVDGEGEGYGISIDARLDNGFQAIANYVEFDGGDTDRTYGIAIGYEFGAFLVAANYGQVETSAGDDEGFGVVANYDLGGGAELQAGYGFNDPATGSNEDTYSFGISMSF